MDSDLTSFWYLVLPEVSCKELDKELHATDDGQTQGGTPKVPTSRVIQIVRSPFNEQFHRLF